MKVSLLDFEQTFLGSYMGVGLHRRHEKDKHVLVSLLINDEDGNWYVIKNTVSSFIFKDLTYQFFLAHTWMEENCIKTKWGYEYKK